MTDLLLCEELFLLTHDDESGKVSSATMSPETAFAGAILLDLAEAGAVTVDGKSVVPGGTTPAHPLLAEALAVLADSDKHRSVSHWVQRLPWKIKKIQDRVGGSLVDRGVLGREEHKSLGVFTTTRWPERDPQPERQLRAGLQDVLVRGVAATPHQAMLVPLLSALNLVPSLVEKDDRKAAKDTAKDIVRSAKNGDLVSSAVSQTVRDTQAAVLSVIMMSAVTSSVTTN